MSTISQDGASQLRPKTDYFYHTPTHRELLLCLFGTLLCGHVHLIPIEIWVPLAYPQQPPIVRIAPGPNVAIRATPSVHLDGKVNMPLLHPPMWTFNSTLSAVLPPIAAEIAANVPFYPQQGRTVTPPVHESSPVGNSTDRMVQVIREKLQKRHLALHSQLLLEANCLLEENAALSDSEALLLAQKSALGSETERVESMISALKQRARGIQDLVENPPQLGPPIEWSEQGHQRQLQNLKAVDSAISDTIRVMWEHQFGDSGSFASEQVARSGLQEYMRILRIIAREQFMAKALIFKISSV